MKKSAADVTASRLIDEGWTLDHSALYPGYIYAGSVSTMQTRRGYEYCRVHAGRCKNVRIGRGYWKAMQVTEVYRRPVTA